MKSKRRPVQPEMTDEQIMQIVNQAHNSQRGFTFELAMLIKSLLVSIIFSLLWAIPITVAWNVFFRWLPVIDDIKYMPFTVGLAGFFLLTVIGNTIRSWGGRS